MFFSFFGLRIKYLLSKNKQNKTKQKMAPKWYSNCYNYFDGFEASSELVQVMKIDRSHHLKYCWCLFTSGTMVMVLTKSLEIIIFGSTSQWFRNQSTDSKKKEPIYIFEVLIGISKGPTLLCMLYKSHLVSFSPLLLMVNKSCCAYF